ncbi:DUF6602 domain-containing protein [Exiguobacterium sp. s22]|uniref:DUF6602 domain-containing protein n=1 Tax=Exiguobacterium sp. s22 TaxID=2751272 RepID=UPI001BEA5990|nr:DUF6602 domain-containing protein [Exiguobacterium sp. s22]
MKISSLNYQETISQEFKAYQNKVRNLIGKKHYGADGNYKEIILINFLKKIVPLNLSVGTGFVKSSTIDNLNNNAISTQIDVIIYNNSYPVYFKEGDFVIVPPESVKGVIEVKTSQTISVLANTINKSNSIQKIISHEIFNGIFVYDTKSDFYSPTEKLESSMKLSLKSNSSVNHIVINENKSFAQNGIFIKKSDDIYSCYDLGNISVGYFFSNLLEYVSDKVAPSMKSHMYPIMNGKTSKMIWQVSKYEY